MFYIYAFAYMSFVFAGLVLLGTALYYLDKWLDNDEQATSTAKHRA